MKRDPLMVVGMHRSGTSLLTQLLQRNGLFMGHQLDRNYESAVLATINDGVLKKARSFWDEPARFQAKIQERGFYLSASEHCRLSWFHQRNQMAFWGTDPTLRVQHWGFKDPRLVITLPCWLELFPEARFVFIRRHGVDVAHSLHTRHLTYFSKHFSHASAPAGERIESGVTTIGTRCATLAGAFELWRLYMQQQASWEEKLLAMKLPVVSLRYESLLEQPQEALRTLSDGFALSLSDETIAASVGVIRPGRAYAYQTDKKLRQFAKEQEAALQAFGYAA